MSDLAIASQNQALEPLHVPSSADGLDAVDDAPDVPGMPVHDDGITTDVPVNYVSDAALLAWLQTKSSGQYGELDQLMDTSNARSKLVKDLSNLKETLANTGADPQAALAEIDAMKAAYAGTEHAAELEKLFAPIQAKLDAQAEEEAAEVSTIGLPGSHGGIMDVEAMDDASDAMEASLAPEFATLSRSIDSTIKDLEHDDQLALVQIQALMSEIRETAQLTSNIIANRSQTADSIVGNLRG